MRKLPLLLSKKTIRISIGLITFFVFAVPIYLGLRRENKLTMHGEITTGVIVGERRTNKGYLELEYEFKIKEETYRNVGNNIDLVLVAGRDFQGKSFPIIYYPQNPEYNHVLISPVDFKKYNMKFPDSLNWVKDYLR